MVHVNSTSTLVLIQSSCIAFHVPSYVDCCFSDLSALFLHVIIHSFATYILLWRQALHITVRFLADKRLSHGDSLSVYSDKARILTRPKPHIGGSIMHLGHRSSSFSNSKSLSCSSRINLDLLFPVEFCCSQNSKKCTRIRSSCSPWDWAALGNC